MSINYSLNLTYKDSIMIDSRHFRYGEYISQYGEINEIPHQYREAVDNIYSEFYSCPYAEQAYYDLQEVINVLQKLKDRAYLFI